MELEITNEIFSYQRKTNEKLNKLDFTDNENKIFNIIKSNLEKNKLNNVICRVSGGWVRDKVLKYL